MFDEHKFKLESGLVTVAGPAAWNNLVIWRPMSRRQRHWQCSRVASRLHDLFTVSYIHWTIAAVAHLTLFDVLSQRYNTLLVVLLLSLVTEICHSLQTAVMFIIQCSTECIEYSITGFAIGFVLSPTWSIPRPDGIKSPLNQWQTVRFISHLLPSTVE